MQNPRSNKNILVTGLPGVGKTTLVIGLAEALARFQPAGFYTSELRERGVRQGFELVSLDGRRSLLSHVDIKSPYVVGRYGVDIRGFEGFLDTLDFTGRGTGLIVIMHFSNSLRDTDAKNPAFCSACRTMMERVNI